MNDQPRFQGRLELTWTNKHLRLLGREDDGYEWVDRADYRVAEVRLLHEHDTVGEVSPPRHRARDNLLIRGDALHVLRSLAESPEWAAEYAGKVRLVYLDPPFNTGQAFEQYDDGLEHSVWLTMLRDRLEQIRRLLAPDGSIWLHLDDVEVHRARCVMDEVFGATNFVASIIWRKTHSRENRTDMSTIHENIVLYARDRQLWSRSRNRLPASPEVLADYINLDDDPRGPWKRTPAHAKAEKGRRASQYYEITTPSGRVVTPPDGRCWLYTKTRFAQLVADDRVWFGREGTGVPRIKKFLSEVNPDLVPTSIWGHDEVGTTGDAKQEVARLFPGAMPFSTPKPERLLRRVIEIATNPGDIVLDPFAGSGTTAAVAHKMGRRWVTIEWSADTVATYVVPRLEKVVRGEDPGGVTETCGWQGGGGFRLLDVAPSMYDRIGRSVFLAEWATNGALAEACAAQLGYRFELDGPFCGLKGRTRLAVVDGLVDEHTVRMIIGELRERERVVIAATASDPDAATALRQLSPGSRLRKIPDALLRSYVRETRLNRLTGREPTSSSDELVPNP